MESQALSMESQALSMENHQDHSARSPTMKTPSAHLHLFSCDFSTNVLKPRQIFLLQAGKVLINY